MVLVMLPLSRRDAVNHGSFHFLVGFPNAEPDPVPYPDSRVERGAERHNALTENHWWRRLGKVAGTGILENRSRYAYSNDSILISASQPVSG